MDIDDAARVFTDPKAYADESRFHAACALLRREAPVVRVAVEHYSPFWAITKHADVMEIERQNDLWLSAPRPALGPTISQEEQASEMPVRTLSHAGPRGMTTRRPSSAHATPREV